MKSALEEQVARRRRVSKTPEDFALPGACRKRAKIIRGALSSAAQEKSPVVLQEKRQQQEEDRDEDGPRSRRTLAASKIPAQIHDERLASSPPNSNMNKILDRAFYECSALELAPRLLGKFLRRDEVILRITEVEAYGQEDTACHGRFGVTTRTAPLFGAGGHAYVYLCYGLHTMLNVVADKAGVGAAVLIRACSPVSGLEAVQERRKQRTDRPMLLTGPGKVGQALGLSTEWSGHALYAPGRLEVLDGPAPQAILVGPRVGIDYASPQDVAALWRFAVAGTPWVSAPRNTLRPAAAPEEFAAAAAGGRQELASAPGTEPA